MSEFNIYEEKILKTLHSSRIPLSTKEVAEKSGIAWNTARKHLRSLSDNGYVKNHDEGNSIEWEMSVDSDTTTAEGDA